MRELGKISTAGLIIVLSVVMVVIMIISSFLGSVDIPFDEVVRILLNKIFGYGDISDIKESHVAIIWRLYAPRAIRGLVVGAALTLAGVVMQAMVKNPLADPYILGISSGASLGATFAILMGTTVLAGTVLADFGVEVMAFVGAMIASVAVFALSSIGGRMTSVKLVLSGTIIASLCSSFSSLIVYLAPNASKMRDLTFWSMGSLAGQDFNNVLVIGIIMLVALIFFLTQMRNLNAMMLGDETATTLGVDLATLRKIYILITALLIGIVVSYCGIIGFVGLIIPHIARALVGTNHWKLLPISVLLGAIFLMSADIVSRVFTVSNIPIGIITALCGAPVFAYIMIKKAYGFGGGGN